MTLQSRDSDGLDTSNRSRLRGVKAFGLGTFARIADLAVGMAAVAERPGLLDEVGGRKRAVLHSCPSVLTSLFGVKVVEQHELAGLRLVEIRRDLGAEDRQLCGIAISFLHVAKNLIVGAILLDDVDHMLDRRLGSPSLGGNRIALRTSRSRSPAIDPL